MASRVANCGKCDVTLPESAHLPGPPRHRTEGRALANDRRGLAADAEGACRRPAAVAANDWPVIQPPLGEQRKATSAAESSGRPRRPSGISASIRSRSSDESQPVSVGPGSTALTLIPRGANSAAAETVIHSSAPLLAA